MTTSMTTACPGADRGSFCIWSTSPLFRGAMGEGQPFSSFAVHEDHSASPVGHLEGFSCVADQQSSLSFRVSELDCPAPSLSSRLPSYVNSNHNCETRSVHRQRGPRGGCRRNKRLHQEFKALSKVERQRMVEQQAATSDLLERTVHLRFLPITMKQSELTDLCFECGELLRVRICGNAINNQNWIYGFVEFASRDAAARLIQKNGMELYNGPDRPPLRLRCSPAHKPIVDRVFHDADPDTDTPCIFGRGSFATRWIKDALDSYLNLKVKESQQNQQGDRDSFVPLAAGCQLSLHAGTSQSTPFPLYAGLQATCGASDAHSDGGDSINGSSSLNVPGVEGALTGSTCSTLSEHMHSLSTDKDSDFLTLSAALQTAMSSPFVVNGYEVLERGRALAVTAIRQGSYAVHTHHKSCDAIGTLRSLLELLDHHSPLTGTAAHCGATDRHAELPQKVTQLRLLANLMLTLIHMAERNLTDALPFVDDIVKCCNEIPSTPVGTSPFLRSLLQASAPVNSRPSVFYSCSCMSVGGEVEGQSSSCSANVCHGSHRFSCVGREPSELLPTALECLSLPEAIHSSASGMTNCLNDFEDEALYWRDVYFHSFVFNTLLTVGLALEVMQHELAMRIYSLVSNRAKKILDMTCAALDQVLAQETRPGGYSLMECLVPCVAPTNRLARDITSFPKLFFKTAAAHVADAYDKEALWHVMPPCHCVRAFPV